MMRSLTIILSAVLFLSVMTMTGCYRTHLIFDGNMSHNIERVTSAKVAKIHRTFVVGLWELDGSIPLDDICPGGVDHVYQRLGGWSWVISVLSGGVVDARDVDIFCRDGRQAHVTLRSKRGRISPPSDLK